MIAIVDYGVGNLFSLKSSLGAIGEQAIVSGDKKVIENADKLILPGVGAFPDAIKKLQSNGLDLVIKDEVKKGKPLLGICLGMQMLFEKSYEFGESLGLGFISGEIKEIKPLIGDLKVPHIGWNSLDIKRESRLFKYVKSGDYVYFVHSFSAQNVSENDVTATTCYGSELTAAVEKDNVFGTQFHPEKSGNVGLAILKAFSEI